MADLVKPWNDGGSLSVAYDGDGDGTAVFSSSENTGAERTMDVSFADASRSVIIVRTVRQAAGQDAVETYIPLTHIEATGEQYFDLGYIVKETDVIEMFYKNTLLSQADKFYFGIVDGSVATWVDIYNNTGYLRFGQTSSTVERGGKLRDGTLLRIKKSNFEVNNSQVLTLDYAGMPAKSLTMFANKNANGIYGHSSVQCRWFRIYDEDGNLEIDLHPVKRNDGVIGLLDKVSGNFFESQSGVSLVAGDEINVDDGYELIDYVTFNADKLFDVGYINSDDSISCQFVSDRTGQYLYGAISSPHTSSITLYAGSGSNWRWGDKAATFTTSNGILYTTEQTNGSCQLDYKTTSRTKSSDFTTAHSMPLGGYVSAVGAYTPNFKGKVYHFSIKNGDTLLKDWWPCKRLSDGVEGFWDCVTQTFIEPI